MIKAHTRSVIRIIAFCLVPAVAAISLRGADRSALEARFLAEAPRGWAILESSALHLDGSGVATDTYNGTPKAIRAPRHRPVRFLFRDQSALMVRSNPDRGGAVKVTGMNPRYGFQLRGDTESSPYVIDYRGRDFEGISEIFFDDLLRYTRAPWQISGMPLRRLITDPGFKLTSVTPVRRGDKDLVRIDFEYRPPDPAHDPTPVSKRTPIRGGWILLSPNDHWAHQECRITTPWGWIEGAVRYGEKQDGIPTVRRSAETLVRKEDLRKPGEDYAVEKSCEFDRWAYRKVPEREFTLTAFGLPEIDAARPELDLPSRRSYSNHPEYWFLGLGLLFAAVAVALRGLAHRSRR